MKTDMKSEMHNLGYRPPLHISTVTSHCFANSIRGKISETSLNIPAVRRRRISNTVIQQRFDEGDGIIRGLPNAQTQAPVITILF
jgi:hypothetical protein